MKGKITVAMRGVGYLESKELLAIIPARGGSKGVPRKNIRELSGKPLIAYTIEEAKKSRYINRIIVSTEDLEIADISKKYGAEVPFLRPLEFASDFSPSIDAVIYTVNRLKAQEGYYPDLVCLLQCTTPFKRVKDIDGTIGKLLETGMDGAVSVCEAESHPYWMHKFNGDKLEMFIQQEQNKLRRQDLPKVYRLNGAIWVVKTSRLLEERKMVLNNESGYIMEVEDSIDIDTELDFKFAELLMKERLTKQEKE